MFCRIRDNEEKDKSSAIFDNFHKCISWQKFKIVSEFARGELSSLDLVYLTTSGVRKQISVTESCTTIVTI